jgi:phosphoserine phosphatase
VGVARFLVVLDVDSTLINEEAIELIADEAGRGDEVARITERAMAGELDFATSLAERLAALRGLPVAHLTRAATRITLTPGVRELVAGVRNAGGAITVVSGGFHELLDPIAADLAVDAHRANRLDVADERLTGRTSGPVIDAAAKAAALAEWSERFGVPATRTIAVGDGANDLEMMAAAQLSVAFCAKPIVRDRADVCVDTRDLSAVLPLLGIRG